MPVWIKLKRKQNIKANGSFVEGHAGDWFEVGKQYGLRLVSDGIAETIDYSAILDLENCGIVYGNADSEFASIINLPSLHGDIFDLTPPWEYVLYIARATQKEHPAILRNIGMLVNAFNLLMDTDAKKGWDIAAPLLGDTLMACDVGSPDAHAIIRETIGDDRIPIYNTGIIAYRNNTPEIQAFIKCWETHYRTSESLRHAFLLALWETKPLFLALPYSWGAYKR